MGACSGDKRDPDADTMEQGDIAYQQRERRGVDQGVGDVEYEEAVGEAGDIAEGLADICDIDGEGASFHGGALGKTNERWRAGGAQVAAPRLVFGPQNTIWWLEFRSVGGF